MFKVLSKKITKITTYAQSRHLTNRKRWKTNERSATKIESSVKRREKWNLLQEERKTYQTYYSQSAVDVERTVDVFQRMSLLFPLFTLADDGKHIACGLANKSVHMMRPPPSSKERVFTGQKTDSFQTLAYSEWVAGLEKRQWMVTNWIIPKRFVPHSSFVLDVVGGRLKRGIKRQRIMANESYYSLVSISASSSNLVFVSSWKLLWIF